jgi:hypothetical protein
MIEWGQLSLEARDKLAIKVNDFSHSFTCALIPNWAGKAEEIGQNIMSHFSKDGLGMKLNSLHYILQVSHPHYCTLCSLGSDFKTGRKTVSFDNQGMVACCRERIG